MQGFTQFRVWLAAMLLVLGVAVGACAQGADFQPDMLFHSLRHGASQIYLANSGSGETRRFRVGSDEDIDATWSPDGQRLLFVSRQQTNSDIYVADADGSNVRRLTDHPGFDGGARWSPDGRSIAFMSGRSGSTKLYLMNADGSNLHRLTDLVEGDEISHAWSPDGRRIAFARVINRRVAVWTVNADGSGAAKLTAGKTNETNPVWSPSGAELAYVASRQSKVTLKVVDLASNTERELAAALTSKSDPAWTADGKHLMIEGRADNNPRTDVFMVPVAGGDLVNLTNHPSEEMNATLSPDGNRLSFVSYRIGAFGQVFVLDLKSGVLKQITDSGKHEFRPVWRPRPGKLGAARMAASIGGVG